MSLRPGLRRLDLTVLKNKAANDPAQVPTAATVTVHRQGATCESSATIAPSEALLDPIQVSDVGSIRKLDTLVVFRSGVQQTGFVKVLLVPSLTELMLANTSTETVTLQPGDRFVVSDPLPTIYGNRRGDAGDVLANPFSTDATSGRGGAYVPLERFDYTVTPSGGIARLYPDVTAGRLEIINALDYPNLQDAVNAIPTGGAGLVWLPAGGYHPKSVPAFTPPPDSSARSEDSPSWRGNRPDLSFVSRLRYVSRAPRSESGLAAHRGRLSDGGRADDRSWAVCLAFRHRLGH